MALAENEYAAPFVESVAITLFDGLAGCQGADREVFALDGQVGACCQTHEIGGVRHSVNFIEVVDAPDEPALGIAPGPEVFHVQIAYCEELWRGGEFGANLGPDLRPAVKGCTQKRKHSRGHFLMFVAQILTDKLDAAGEPFLDVLCSFMNLHRRISSNVHRR